MIKISGILACPDHGLSIDDAPVSVVASGGLAADRAEELWSSVEYALEVAVDRRVSVDLTGVTGFDLETMQVLRDVVGTALRRRDDIQIVLRADSALQEYARSYGLVASHDGTGTVSPDRQLRRGSLIDIIAAD